ncbi:IQ motif and ubiquitin-like domain-containing protein [Cloeon dipterum]|uniref:IQ motif and ubiquitin-like domain-containing protein n=1 Tax=Cloeon dipterum TaxID=197152 RepID=UPI00321F925E
MSERCLSSGSSTRDQQAEDGLPQNKDDASDAGKQERQGSDEETQVVEEKRDEIIFVKLWLPQGLPFTLTSYRSMTIEELRAKVAAELFLPLDMLVLVQAGEPPKLLHDDDDDGLVRNLMGQKGSILELYVHCTDPDVDYEVPDTLRAKPTDILTVIVYTGHMEKMVVVEIEHDCREKEFLGGYRCKRSGREYYHASCQTSPDKPKILKYSRKVQTQNLVSHGQQTPRAAWTQTEEKVEGRVMAPSVPDNMADVAAKVVVIQKFFRGWRVRRGLERLKEEALDRQELRRFLEQDAAAGRYNPTTFEVLYQLVERWRKRCLEYAFATKTQGPSRADFQDILEMQVNMLAIIEKERIKMRDKRLKEREKQLLDEVCSPVKWKSYKGVTVSMDTLKSQRACKLKQLHDKLFAENQSATVLKETLNETLEALDALDEPNKYELIQLMEREVQLLEMGLGIKETKNLHLRLEKVFANLIRDPSECKKPRSRLYLCSQCRKMLPPKVFVVPLTRPEIKVCTSCNWIDNMSHGRVDHGPFAVMLKELQQHESRRGCYRSMAFVLEVHDVKYLVDQIWHGQSAISQAGDVHELRLGRWDTAKEWSPWNTVLLTRKELQEHLNISELKLIYGEEFVKNVNIKHLIAQMHFKGLQNFK